MDNKNFLIKCDVFSARTEGYHNFRIPVLAITKKGTLLAFGEARRGKGGDWDSNSIVMKRSTDGGKTWGELKVIAGGSEKPYHNTVIIIDRFSDVIHLIYCNNYDKAYYAYSVDDGISFSETADITYVFENFKPQYPWNVIAAGPGHSIQLKNGRIVVPVWMSDGSSGTSDKHRPSVVSVIYSDDRGKTWEAGDIIPNTLRNPSETTALELEDGRVLLNIRNEHLDYGGRRAVSISDDGATNWSVPEFDRYLLEPVCCGSILRYTDSLTYGKSRVLFSNPHTLEGKHFGKPVFKDRKNLSVKLSYDECKTWPINKVLDEGISGYSDLAVDNNGYIYCLYERGGVNGNQYDNEALCLAKFDLEWLTGGKDSLKE